MPQLPPAVLLRQDLADSIAEALLAEGRRNEAIIAYVRAGLFTLISSTELYWAFVWTGDAADSIPFVYRLPILLMTPFAIGLAVVLHRGWFHPAVGILAPLVDFAVVGARLQASFGTRTPESLAEHHDLATVSAATAALMLSGAFRLSWRSAWETVVLGLIFYAWFASYVNILPAQVVTHLFLLAGVGGVAIGMTYRLLRMLQTEVARQTLKRFIPEHIMAGAHEDPLAMISRPRSVEATVLVSDMRNYTGWAENRSPLEVLTFLNRVQGALAEEVHAQGGLVDKFLGDGMLAVFGAIQPMPDHADRALAAARGMLAAMDRLNATLPEEDQVRIGIGLHSGDIVVGVLGAGAKLEFTALGDTVNTAARIETLTKERGGPILLSADTRSRLASPQRLTSRGEVVIRGRSMPTELYSTEG